MANVMVEHHRAKASRDERARLTGALRAKADEIARRSEEKRLEARQTAYELRRNRSHFHA